jgi:hypothetical protein
MLPVYSIQPGSVTNRYADDLRPQYWVSTPTLSCACSTCGNFGLGAFRLACVPCASWFSNGQNGCVYRTPYISVDQCYLVSYHFGNAYGWNCCEDSAGMSEDAVDATGNAIGYAQTTGLKDISCLGLCYDSELVKYVTEKCSMCGGGFITQGGKRYRTFCTKNWAALSCCWYDNYVFEKMGNVDYCESSRRQCGCSSTGCSWVQNSYKWRDLGGSTYWACANARACGTDGSGTTTHTLVDLSFGVAQQSPYCALVCGCCVLAKTVTFRLNTIEACCNLVPCGGQSFSKVAICMDKTAGKFYIGGLHQAYAASHTVLPCNTAFHIVEGDIPTYDCTYNACCSGITRIIGVPRALFFGAGALDCCYATFGASAQLASVCQPLSGVYTGSWYSGAQSTNFWVCGGKAVPFVLNTNTCIARAFYHVCVCSPNECNTCRVSIPGAIAYTPRNTWSFIAGTGSRLSVWEYNCDFSTLLCGWTACGAYDVSSTLRYNNAMYDKYTDSWIVVSNCCGRDSVQTGAGADAVIAKFPTNASVMSQYIENARGNLCSTCSPGCDALFGYGDFFTGFYSHNNTAVHYSPFAIVCSTLAGGYIKSGTPGCFCGYISNVCACNTNNNLNSITYCTVVTCTGCFTNCATPLSIARSCSCGGVFSSPGNHAEGLYTYGNVLGGVGAGGGRARVVAYITT